MFADIGCQGRISDGGVIKNSSLWNKMKNNLLQLPMPTPLPNKNTELPYVFLGDGAFALDKNLMKPYPGEHQEGTMERVLIRNFRRPVLLLKTHLASCLQCLEYSVSPCYWKQNHQYR